MTNRWIAAGVAASMCLGVIGTSFAQSVGKVDIARTDQRKIREIPEIQVPIEKQPEFKNPNGDVMNWAAVAAVAAAVYAVTEVAHHAKERWFPGGVETPIDVINPASQGLFDVPQLEAPQAGLTQF